MSVKLFFYPFLFSVDVGVVRNIFGGYIIIIIILLMLVLSVIFLVAILSLLLLLPLSLK